MRRAAEHNAQVAFIRWAYLQASAIPALRMIYAVPNGGHRDPRVGARLKREGVRRGVSDLHLPYPVFPFHGLWIEMKTGKVKPTAAQTDWLELMSDAGHGAVVAYGWEAAKDATLDYLAGRLSGEVSTYR
jgi:hypothetical protein